MANITGTNATDNINGTNARDVISGLGGSDGLFGLGGNDRLLGGDGDDYMEGGVGDDEIVGGSHEDFMVGGAGDDTLDGRPIANDPDDFDTAFYAADGGTSGIVANLATGVATDTFGDTDRLIDIEVLVGSEFADRLTGGNAANDDFEDLRGLAGNDTINGGSGFDRVTYSSDRDFGGFQGVVVNLATGTARDGFGNTDQLAGIEGARGTNASDEFIGNNADNRFEPLGDHDLIDGGGGFDMVSYANDVFITGNLNGRVGIRAFLGNGQIVDTSGYYVDTVVRVEAVRGSVFDDEIRGNAVANRLEGIEGDDFILGGGGNDDVRGGAGEDNLRGNAANDTIEGGAGDDSMRGGEGNDRFVFARGDDFDEIRGFENGPDRLDFSAYGFQSANDVLAAASDRNGNTVIDFDDDVIVLVNFDRALLNASDIIV